MFPGEPGLCPGCLCHCSVFRPWVSFFSPSLFSIHQPEITLKRHSEHATPLFQPFRKSYRRVPRILNVNRHKCVIKLAAPALHPLPSSSCSSLRGLLFAFWTHHSTHLEWSSQMCTWLIPTTLLVQLKYPFLWENFPDRPANEKQDLLPTQFSLTVCCIASLTICSDGFVLVFCKLCWAPPGP